MARRQPWGEGWFWMKMKWILQSIVASLLNNIIQSLKIWFLFSGWPCSRKLCRVPVLIKGGCYIWLDCQAKYQRFEVPRLNFLVRSVSRQICRSAPQFWALSWEEGKLCRIESSWKPVITSKTSKSFFCPEFKIYVITHPTFDLSWHSCNLWCWSSDWIASGSNIIRNPSLERHLYPFHDNIIITFQQQDALVFGQPRKKWSDSWKELKKCQFWIYCFLYPAVPAVWLLSIRLSRKP